MRTDAPEPAALTAIVVNDDTTQRDLLSRLLGTAGLEVRSFEGAEAALLAMDRARPPVLIVTDLYMPGIDGWRFCRLLRSPEYAAFNQVPILVVSATFSGAEASRIAADLGAEAFLYSPVDSQRFCEQVRAILRGERARNPLRVLIVEDSPTQSSIFRNAFETHGYQADTALTARAAADAFARTAYDAAVLDYHLPDGNGDALLDEFRALRPDCVCLMITSDTGPELALDWMKRGAAAHLQKPFKPEYLIELCVRARRERAVLRVQDLLEMRTRELREASGLLEAAVTQSPSGILIASAPDVTIRLANPAALAIRGCDKELLTGIDVTKHAVNWQMFRPDGSPIPPEQLPLSRAVLKGEVTRNEEAIIRDEGGNDHWVNSNAAPIYDAQGCVTAGIVVFHDITERKRAAAEVAKLETQFQQAQKMESVGRLAGGVAHDFNNMLQAILGNAHLALAEIPPGSPARESLEEIQKCAQRSADLTRRLLAFARKQTIAPQVLDLNETVESLLNMLRRLIGEDIHLAWVPAAGLGSVKMDPTQVDQILANLCINARDAIGGVGRVTIETANTTFGEAYCAAHPGFQPGEYVWVAVSDDGCGMDQETLTHIFEPFFTTKAVGEGTGLGLATIYGIVKQNTGFVSVDSEPGKGTTFKIYLPRHESQAPEIRPARVADLAGSRGETVLLVEDEPAILAIARRVLERLGYTVLTASTPAEAIRLAGAHASGIHLLMTDVVMPEMNGRDLAKRLLSLHPKLKCLFMSGYTANIIAHHGVLDQGVHFIQKPFSMGDLAAKIRAVLDSLGGS